MPRIPLAMPLVLILSSCVARPNTPASSPSNSPSDASAASAAPTNAAVVGDKVLPIPGFGHGINLGNGLDAPSEGEWGVVLDSKHFEMAKAAGFDHVRLPVRFSAHADTNAPYAIDPKFFARVDWALDEAQKLGLHVILDLHHYNELMDDPDGHAARFVGLWQQISERYAARPDTVAFELLNEPCKKLNPIKTNALHKQAISLIRSKNPQRLIFVDSYFWANTNYLKALELPNDPQVVAEFHMYQPILFTHQGAPWMDPEYGTTGIVFPGPPTTPIVPVEAAQKVSWVRDFFKGYNELPADRNPSGLSIVVGEFDRALNHARQSGHRVYLGEFAAIDKADPDSRFRFIKAVRAEADRRGIGWCYWDDGGMNKAMNIVDGTWVQPIFDALTK
jgi:endoglucanase